MGSQACLLFIDFRKISHVCLSRGILVRVALCSLSMHWVLPMSCMCIKGETGKSFQTIHILWDSLRLATTVIFKGTCTSFLFQSKVYVETAIQMALQPPSVYHKMQRVFSMFEAGELKEQKRPTATAASRKKALQGHYSAKLQHFKMFQGLQVNSLENDHIF